MKKMIITATIAFWITAAAGIAGAGDYTVTWKNQLGQSSCAPMEMRVIKVTGGKIVTKDENPMIMGDTRTMTINSATCVSIELLTTCRFPGLERGAMVVRQLDAKAPCANSTITISQPGVVTVTTP